MASDVMNAIGKRISSDGRESAYRACRDDMGLDTGAAWELVGKIADLLERDQPFEAEKVGLESPLDVTGYYRLAATLLAHTDGA